MAKLRNFVKIAAVSFSALKRKKLIYLSKA
jgi:hypothetical protein